MYRGAIELMAYPKPFRFPWPTPPAAAHCNPPTVEHAECFFIGYRKAENSGPTVSVDLQSVTKKFCDGLARTATKSGWHDPSMKVEFKLIKRKQIPPASIIPDLRELLDATDPDARLPPELTSQGPSVVASAPKGES
eukprot:SAG31_NODE_3966_length_3709_cov_1.391967_1_plen_136_part_10